MSSSDWSVRTAHAAAGRSLKPGRGRGCRLDS
jgi:hypothetical protein